MELTEADSPPAPLEKWRPDYPPLARKLRQEGVVHLRLLVNERGTVDQVEVLSSDASTLLERAAIKTARRWTYRPATKDETPVKVWIVEPVVFQFER